MRPWSSVFKLQMTDCNIAPHTCVCLTGCGLRHAEGGKDPVFYNGRPWGSGFRLDQFSQPDIEDVLIGIGGSEARDGFDIPECLHHVLDRVTEGPHRYQGCNRASRFCDT